MHRRDAKDPSQFTDKELTFAAVDFVLTLACMLSREARLAAWALLGASGALLLYFAWRRYAARPRSLDVRARAVGMLLGGAIGDAKGIAYDGQKVHSVSAGI